VPTVALEYELPSHGRIRGREARLLESFLRACAQLRPYCMSEVYGSLHAARRVLLASADAQTADATVDATAPGTVASSGPTQRLQRLTADRVTTTASSCGAFAGGRIPSRKPTRTATK
jgi:hypothetical protein